MCVLGSNGFFISFEKKKLSYLARSARKTHNALITNTRDVGKNLSRFISCSANVECVLSNKNSPTLGHRCNCSRIESVLPLQFIFYVRCSLIHAYMARSKSFTLHFYSRWDCGKSTLNTFYYAQRVKKPK